MHKEVTYTSEKSETLKKVYDELVSILGPEKVWNDEAFTSCYPGRHYVLPFPMGGNEEYKPDIVVAPKNTQEVSETVKLANKYKIPVTPSGAHAMVVPHGGVLPQKGGIMLDLRSMNSIIEIDEENLSAAVQPGITIYALNLELEKRGLFFPDQPAPFTVVTMGGRVSQNGCGILSPRYGRPTDLVISLEVVLPNGEIIRTGPRKVYDNNAAIDILRLFLGAEGILGVITEITLRIYPIPERREIEAMVFPTYEACMKATRKFLTIGAAPECLLMHDGSSWKAYVWNIYRDFYKRPEPDIADSAGVLMVGYGGKTEFVDVQMKLCHEIMEEFGGKLMAKEDTMAWYTCRNSALKYNPSPTVYGKKRGYIINCIIPHSEANFKKFCDKFTDLIKKYGFERWGLQIWFESQMGNLTPILTYGAKFNPKSEEERKRIVEYTNEIQRFAIEEFGGGIGGMEGTGLYTAHLTPYQFEPNTMKLIRKIKNLLDPNNIMNPDKKFPLEEML